MSKGTRAIGRSLAAAGILACLILGHRAWAQPGAAPQPPRRIYTNKPEFHLPVKLPEEHRANLREMGLYVKSAQSDWSRVDSVPPSGTRFTYRVPADGEYFFTVVTVDKAGKSIPADVRAVPPGLRVVVDTLPPQLEVHPFTSPDGDQFLKCTMIDANPNAESIRLTIRNTSGNEVILDPYNGQSGLFRLVGPDTIPVRITACDLALNTTTMELNAKEMLGEKFAGTPPPAVPRPNVQTPATQITIPSVPNGGGITNVGYTPDAPRLPVVVNSGKVDLPGPPPTAGVSDPRLPTATPALPPSLPVASDNLPKIPSAPVAASPVSISPSATASQRHLIRSTQANVAYRIDQVGASGVGKVEVFVTANEGQTWKKLKEDANKRSPVAIDLPGEGTFGLSVVVTNGNGFGGTTPKRGDSPPFVVEVDCTSPFVQLKPIEPSSATNGILDIRWSASDKNLHNDSVNLFYKTKLDSAWQSIATNVKNDGLHRWPIPRDVGAQFFFKVEVADHAGNIGRAESPTPIVLDLTEPKGVVVGVTAGGPLGN